MSMTRGGRTMAAPRWCRPCPPPPIRLPAPSPFELGLAPLGGGQERLDCETTSETERELAFLRPWTRKKACLKGGTGLRIESSPAGTGLDAAARQLRINIPCGVCKVAVRSLAQEPGRVAALAHVPGGPKKGDIGRRSELVQCPLRKNGPCAQTQPALSRDLRDRNAKPRRPRHIVVREAHREQLAPAPQSSSRCRRSAVLLLACGRRCRDVASPVRAAGRA